jgi:hypothetical protein
MGGFYIAAVRHSWRVYYNRVIPTIIMGRYLIVFSAVFFIIAFVTLSRFKKTTFSSKWRFMLIAQALPVVLVLFAYLTVIKGAIIPTSGDLLKSLGSVDAFFTEILGVYFFVLLFIIYGITNWLMWKGSSKTALITLTVSLVIYYAAGIPSYYQTLMDFQTFPWLAKQIVPYIQQPDPKKGGAEPVTVFLPENHNANDGVEIFNGLYTHGIDNVQIEDYSPQAVDNMVTARGFIIQKLDPATNAYKGLPILRFNRQDFVIIPVNK